MAAKRADVFDAITRFFNDWGPGYCLLGRTDSLPAEFPGDVDIVIGGCSEPADFHVLAKRVAEACGVDVVQHLQHEATSHYYVLSWREAGGERGFLHLDLCSEYLRDGVALLSAAELLSGRVPAKDFARPGRGFYVAEPSVEFLYYLLKRVDKGSMAREHAQHLHDCWIASEGEGRHGLRRFWSDGNAERIAVAAATNDWHWVFEHLPDLRRDLQRGRWRRTNSGAECARIWQRLRNPTGLHVALLGPDGSGKTSIIDGMLPRVAPMFRHTTVSHLFPGPRVEKPPVLHPHHRTQRGAALSSLQLSRWYSRYTVGWLRSVYRMKVASTLVVFDRYFHDAIVDPCRYGLANALPIARFVSRAIPSPDLWLVLDVPPEVAQRRKPEVAPEETERQRHAYVELARDQLENATVLDASRSLEHVVGDAVETVVAYMKERTRLRLES